MQVCRQLDSTTFFVLGLNFIENLHNFLSIREGIIEIIMRDTKTKNALTKDKYLNDDLRHRIEEV